MQLLEQGLTSAVFSYMEELQRAVHEASAARKLIPNHGTKITEK